MAPPPAILLLICPHCKRTEVASSRMKFCHSDGEKLIPVPRCEGCGGELLDHYRFCPKCGRKKGDK